MRTSFRTLFVLFIFGMIVSINVIARHTQEVFSCPVTMPTDQRPLAADDPFPKGEHTYSVPGIWVSVPERGVIALSPADEIAYGKLKGWRATEVDWMRDTFVSGKVIVTGARLDQISSLAPTTPLSPTRQYTNVGYVRTGLAFPSEGCWEIIGSIGDYQISWVVDVRFVDILMATPSR